MDNVGDDENYANTLCRLSARKRALWLIPCVNLLELISVFSGSKRIKNVLLFTSLSSRNEYKYCQDSATSPDIFRKREFVVVIKQLM